VKNPTADFEAPYLDGELGFVIANDGSHNLAEVEPPAPGSWS
jgi:hypothetical protein